MFCMLKKKKICPAYVSKHNSNCQKQVILLMILNGEGWHYLPVRNIKGIFFPELPEFLQHKQKT